MDQQSSKTYDMSADWLQIMGLKLNQLKLNGQSYAHDMCYDVQLIVAGPSRDVQSGEEKRKDEMVASCVKAHRLVLSAASPVFEAMFTSKSDR